MTRERWREVDGYINGALIAPDEALDAAIAASSRAGLPPIAVTPAQGKLLNLVARALGASRILELGTLGGYSTIWLARALPPGGRLITLEANAAYAEIARSNIAHAGLGEIVELHQGAALETLPALAAEGLEPFDLIFIDADKQNTPAYFDWALEHSHPGSMIIADNVIRDGALIDPASDDPAVLGGRRLHELLAAEQAAGGRVDATTIQTVGGKGYDGFTLALVRG